MDKKNEKSYEKKKEQNRNVQLNKKSSLSTFPKWEKWKEKIQNANEKKLRKYKMQGKLIKGKELKMPWKSKERWNEIRDQLKERELSSLKTKNKNQKRTRNQSKNRDHKYMAITPTKDHDRSGK